MTYIEDPEYERLTGEPGYDVPDEDEIQKARLFIVEHADALFPGWYNLSPDEQDRVIGLVRSDPVGVLETMTKARTTDPLYAPKRLGW